MTLTWVREENPAWDDDKARVIGGAPEGAFVLPYSPGDPLPGAWWSARDGDAVLGYGRLDVTWGGDAEILLAVDPAGQRRGVGSFVLARLEEEAARQGINYVHNRIRQHAERDLVHDWLVVRGFRGSTDSELRKRVGAAAAEPLRTPPVTARYAAEAGDQPPGHEEQGGYVDVEDHQY